MNFVVPRFQASSCGIVRFLPSRYLAIGINEGIHDNYYVVRRNILRVRTCHENLLHQKAKNYAYSVMSILNLLTIILTLRGVSEPLSLGAKVVSFMTEAFLTHPLADQYTRD